MPRDYFVRDIAQAVGITSSAVVRYWKHTFGEDVRKAWEPNGAYIFTATEYRRIVRSIRRKRAKVQKERDQAEA